jgi:hypothetical protein
MQAVGMEAVGVRLSGLDLDSALVTSTCRLGLGAGTLPPVLSPRKMDCTYQGLASVHEEGVTHVRFNRSLSDV